MEIEDIFFFIFLLSRPDILSMGGKTQINRVPSQVKIYQCCTFWKYVNIAVFLQETSANKDNYFLFSAIPQQKESFYSDLAFAESLIATWWCGVPVPSLTTWTCIFYPWARVKTKQMGKDPTMCGLGPDDDKLARLRRLNAQRHVYLTRCVLSHSPSGFRISSK